MKKLVILSGAGMSAESGIKTFRDAGGLWEGHDVMEVASPEGWRKNNALVLDFYNQRRRQLFEVQPNQGHIIAAELEKDFDVHIITQNVDDLHERAGSTKVLHLHGELLKARSVNNENDIIEWKTDINVGDLHTDGHQLRPHIVWFGEMVPAIIEAADIVKEADYIVIVGTSMQVYPAAGLVDYVRPTVPIFYIDPNPATIPYLTNSIDVIPMTASEGMAVVRERLRSI
ncbi:SIR2 family NAD-dependent protein deacylase [Flavobacterium suzhouense]|uniref:protein acetyllysine N-acetyltransferase n=1 Tax=Flavobacterium suzhouense TaxID=1529638 RepID=A0ABW5P0G4_9FLAO